MFCGIIICLYWAFRWTVQVRRRVFYFDGQRFPYPKTVFGFSLCPRSGGSNPWYILFSRWCGIGADGGLRFSVCPIIGTEDDGHPACFAAGALEYVFAVFFQHADLEGYFHLRFGGFQVQGGTYKGKPFPLAPQPQVPKVPDLDKPFWQYMLFEPSEEFLMGKQHLLCFGAVRIVFVVKLDMGWVHFKYPVSGDGYWI